MWIPKVEERLQKRNTDNVKKISDLHSSVTIIWYQLITVSVFFLPKSKTILHNKPGCNFWLLDQIKTACLWPSNPIASNHLPFPRIPKQLDNKAHPVKLRNSTIYRLYQLPSLIVSSSLNTAYKWLEPNLMSFHPMRVLNRLLMLNLFHFIIDRRKCIEYLT